MYDRFSIADLLAYQFEFATILATFLCLGYVAVMPLLFALSMACMTFSYEPSNYEAQEFPHLFFFWFALAAILAFLATR